MTSITQVKGRFASHSSSTCGRVPLVPSRKTIFDAITGKLVLDLGCCGDAVGWEKAVLFRQAIAKHYVGFDIRQESIQRLHTLGVDAHFWDLEKPFTCKSIVEKWSTELLQSDKVLLLSGVLEHTRNPGLVLENLATFARSIPTVTLIVTVPSVYSLPMAVYYWLTGRDMDLDDHLMRWSIKNLVALTECSGWQIERAMLYYHDEWEGRPKWSLTATIRRGITRLIPRGAPGFMIWARTSVR